jgi:hypothetical protein
MKLTTIALLFLATACASSRNPELDEKVSQEAAISTSKDLTSQITQELDADSEITPEQREELKALHISHTEKLAGLSREMLELRAVLVKDLLSSPYNEEEVNSIKRRIRKNADARVTAMFNAVDKANSILGRAAGGPKRRKLMRSFVEPQDHGVDRE